jgi:uncharacterized membrane protein YcaP (DUF421 family)
MIFLVAVTAMRTSLDLNDKTRRKHMNTFIDTLNAVLGLNADPRNLTFLQISLRGIIVFVIALVMVRMGDKRFLSRKTAFDAILGFILASMLARAVNGSSAFFPTLAGGFVIVGLHRTMAYLARKSHWFGNLVKGRSDLVIKEGVIMQKAMRQNDLSEHDLLEDLRLNGNTNDLKKVRVAFVERNGQISFVN